MNLKNNLGIVFIIVAVIAVVASVVYARHVATIANEGVVIEPHIKGNADAEVTLVEYSDFQCPACAQFAPYVTELLDLYGEQLSFEYRHFPLVTIHPYAIPAAKAAEAAGQQDAFFAMHDTLFREQSTWSNSANPVPYFEGYAEELGLDVELFSRHYKASLIEDKVQTDFAAARDLGLTGTPTFFLNGERLQLQNLSDLRTAVEEAIGVDEEEDVNGQE